MRKFLMIGAAVAALSACTGIGEQYTAIQQANALAGGVSNTRGMECDGLPLECNGLRWGGTSGGWGGSFPSDNWLWVSKADWEFKNKTALAAEGLKGWDDFAAKYGKPNGQPVNKTLRNPTGTNLGSPGL